MKHEFLWFGVETTGLDPTRGLVLEFSAVLCADAKGGDFSVIQSYGGALHHTEMALSSVQIDPYVRGMHEQSGLWRDVEQSTSSVRDADEFLSAFVDDLTGGKQKITLAGYGPAFATAWIGVHMPEFAKRLSHRTFDVISLRRAVKAWAPYEIEWPYYDVPRSQSKVYTAIDVARVARTTMGWR